MAAASGTAKLKLLLELQNNLKAGLNQAKDQITKVTGSLQNKLSAFKANNIKAFDAIKDQVPGVGKALSLLANPYALLIAAVIGLGTATVVLTKKAAEWEEQMAKINATAGMTKDELANLSDKLLEIGGRNIAPLEEVPQAFNKIISAGLSANDALAALEPTLRAAKATFTDIETVATAAVSVMMSSGRDVNEVYDILTATMQNGNAEFKDIANYLPKVIPLARNVGFALEETAGAYANLTQKLSSEASATALEGIMRSLSNANIVDNFKKLNIDIFDADTGKVKPLIEIIDQLNIKFAGLSDEAKMAQFSMLGLDQSSALGFSTLMQDVDSLRTSIDATTNSAGNLDKMYNNTLTPLDKWRIIQNKIKVEMIKMGQLFLPILSKVGSKILSIIEFWKTLYAESAPFRDLINGLAPIFAYIFKLQFTNINRMINVVKILAGIISSIVQRIGDWIAKVAGIKGGFDGLYNHIRPYLMWVQELLGYIGDLLYDVMTLNVESAYNKIENFKLPSMDGIQQKIADENNPKKQVEIFTGFGKRYTPDTQPEPDTDGTDNGTGDGNNTNNNDLAGIKGDAQTKNITVNIKSFIDTYNPKNETINSMSKDELERWMTDMFLRVVRTAELSV